MTTTAYPYLFDAMSRNGNDLPAIDQRIFKIAHIL
jgi:hypothetical protein